MGCGGFVHRHTGMEAGSEEASSLMTTSQIRKFLLACAAATVVVVLLASWAPSVNGKPVPGPTVTPDAGVGGGQVAVADFFSPLPKGRDGFSAFFVGVARGAGLGPEYARGGANLFVAGETCRVIRVKAKKNKKKGKKDERVERLRHTLECERFEHEGEIPLTDFQMDPLLQSAHLKTQVDGSEIDVTWTAEDDLPSGGGGVGFYGQGAVEAGGIAERWASAEGTIFGHPVRSGDGRRCFSFSVMFEGAGSFAYVGDLAEGFQVPRRASEVSSEGVRSEACSPRIQTARA